ncbi:MAG: cyclic nucleotide-binding domain-containing protein [Gammaproteobacteria bacterium]
MSMTAIQPRISQRNVITWLCESPVFESLSEADIRPLLSSIRILNFKPMDRAIGEGKFSAALYIVIDGHFKVLRPGGVVVPMLDTDDLDALYEFRAGDCFGEYSLLDNQPASASVVAAEASMAIQIPRREFNSVLMSDYRIAKTVYHNLLLLLTSRLRRSLHV